MQDDREMMYLNEHMTDAEIMWAIRYLDPDLWAEKAGEDTGMAIGISFALVTALTGALVYIGLYVWTL